jgi:tRNA(Ile)-lysidine synthase
MTPALPDIARSTVAAHRMLPEGGIAVAMVSGGADSTSLLRLLAAGELGPVRVSVLHVDHMLRGAASDADAAFVRDLCASLSVPCTVVRYDVAAWAAEEGLNLEDAGRRVRYRFAAEELDARCDAEGVPRADGRIAAAHTLDDRIETFAMRLVQGAGPSGLAGPAHVNGRLVRPLLDARRADVVEYLTSLGQGWREDATNADTARLRARVRAEVLPMLREINPRLDEALARTLQVLEDEDALLDGMARSFAEQFRESAIEEVRFHRARMLTLEPAMLRRVVRVVLIDAFPSASRIEFQHVEALVAGLADDAFARDLPGGLRAFTECDRLVVSRAGAPVPSLAPALLEVPGSVELSDAGSMTAEAADTSAVDEDPLSALIDADRLSGPLTIDSARPGDRMRPLGMEGTKKLSDVLTDAKVPRRRRPLVPVVRDGDDVVWLAGVRMSEDYRVRSDTRRAIRLVWTGPVDA